MASSIHIANATLAYNEKIIFSQLTINITGGRWVALIGPSGVGKSSLLRMIAGLMGPNERYEGNIHVDNHLSINQQVAYMAQNDLLMPWLTVLGNATLSLKLRDQKKRSSEITKAKSLLEKVGLGNAMHLFPHQLSGGMRQRAALVRTLMENKPIVLMDEPFSALDAITRYKLQDLAASLLQDKTVLFITHDPTEALRLANEIYIMLGQPAMLKQIVTLTSRTPRSLSDPEIIKLQTLLFDELTLATGDS